MQLIIWLKDKKVLIRGGWNTRPTGGVEQVPSPTNLLYLC